MPSIPIAAGAGANTVVPSQAGRRVRVLGYALTASAAGTVQFQDGGSNNLSGPMALGVGQSLVVPFVPPIKGSSPGWMVTASGTALNLILGTGAAVAGHCAFDYI